MLKTMMKAREHHDALDQRDVERRARLTESRPSPGMPNVYSVRIAPPSAMPRSRPKIVTIGSRALRSAWCDHRRSPAPFARAVRT